jgi:MFS family permease
MPGQGRVRARAAKLLDLDPHRGCTIDTMTAVPAPPAVRAELFGPSRRATTIGLILLISLIAFEAMGVGTAMPAVVADLGALSMYAWPFVSFMAAAVFGTVLGGRWCDRAGPRVPLLVTPVLFGVGLVVAGTATTMAQLLVGRMLQGLGAGALAVAVYVLIAVVYAERARPAVFGLISSAWVLPSLIGPPVSGVVTETLSWHWVFIGLTPFVALAVALVVPAVRRLEPPEPGRGGRAPRCCCSRRRCTGCCRAACSGRPAASPPSSPRAGCSPACSSRPTPTCR